MSQKLRLITQNHYFFKKGLHNCYKYVNINNVMKMKVYRYGISLFFAVVLQHRKHCGSDDFRSLTTAIPQPFMAAGKASI